MTVGRQRANVDTWSIGADQESVDPSHPHQKSEPTRHADSVTDNATRGCATRQTNGTHRGKQMLRGFSKITLTLSLVIGIASASALAHGGATGVVKERMDAMGAIGDAVKTIGQMLRGKTKYDSARIEGAADVIAAHGGNNLTQLFPEDSITGPSEALPVIWSDWVTFQEQADLLETLALKLSTTTDADKTEIGKIFRDVAGTCKACHEKFRLKKE